MKKQFAEFLRTGLLAATLVAGVQLCHGQQGLLLQTYDVELSASANFASLSVAMANKTPTSTTVYKGEVNFLEEDFYVFPVITPGSMVQLVFKGWMKLDPGRYYFYGHSHVYTQLYVDWEKTGDYTFYPLGAWTGQNGTLLTIETAGAYPIYINYFYWRAGEPSSRLDIRWRKLAEDEVVYTEPWQFWSTLNVLDTTTLHSDGSPLFTVSDPASEAWNPWVNTVGVSDIGATTATINGRILAGTPPFTVNLHWGTTDAETGTWATNKSITVAQSLGEISGLIGGLSANQQYFARFSITDSTGVTNWGEGAQSFITLGAPVMGGVSVTEDFFSADLAVNVLRSGDNSTFTVYWGTDLANLASRTLPDAVVGVNLVSLDNLLPNAVYYYTFELSSLYGNASVSGSFLTKGLPVIESITADPSPYGADLHLKLIEPGLNSILTLYWGTQAPVDNASWANTVPLPAPQYGDNVATLSGLQKGATYHYKFEITTQFAPVSISGSFTTVDAFTWVGGANPQASTFFRMGRVRALAWQCRAGGRLTRGFWSRSQAGRRWQSVARQPNPSHEPPRHHHFDRHHLGIPLQ